MTDADEINVTFTADSVKTHVRWNETHAKKLVPLPYINAYLVQRSPVYD